MDGRIAMLEEHTKSQANPHWKDRIRAAIYEHKDQYINNWHIHHAENGGGQMLICVGGRGYYQEWDKAPVEMTPGTVINIPANIKHWHGAAPDSWFSHLALEIPAESGKTEWCEPVSDEAYGKLQ